MHVRSRTETAGRRQILILFACNLIPWTIGNGLLPLMPVYAARLDAPPRLTGLIMAVAYAGLVAGTLAAGWMGDRWPRRRLLLVVAGVLLTPVTVGTGLVAGLSGFAFMLTLLWFLLGIQVGLVTALTGVHAAADRRGLSFGIVGIAPALGLLLGGDSAGALVDRFGYLGLFNAYAALALVAPLLALATTDGEASRRPATRATAATGAPDAAAVGRIGVVAVALALCLSGIATFFGVLVRSLAMDELQLSAAAIAGTQAVTGVFSLPLVLGLGWLSDRMGRERLMLLGRRPSRLVCSCCRSPPGSGTSLPCRRSGHSVSRRPHWPVHT